MDGAVAWILMVPALSVLVSCHQVCFIGSEFNPQSGIPPRWFLPYQDPCECTAIRLGGMYIPASSYRQGAPHYLKELFLSEDYFEIRAYFKCSRTTTASRTTTVGPAPAECPSPGPLGMEDGEITDDRIMVSSSSPCCPASKARLNDNSRWEFDQGDHAPWIKIDLIQRTVVSGVIIQGHGNRYVEQYKVAYQKEPSTDFEHVKDGDGDIKVFIGNTNGNAHVTNQFDASLVATVVRIEPTAWSSHGAALRLELLGCRHD